MSGMKIITKTILWTIAIILVLWAAYNTAPKANALPQQDVEFLQDIRDAGFSYSDPNAMIGEAKWVCIGLALGVPPVAIKDAVVTQYEIPDEAGKVLVGLSAEHYCPQFLKKGQKV